MKKHNKLLLAIAAFILVFIFLALELSRTLSPPSGNEADADILNRDNANAPEPIFGDDRERDYRERPVFPESVVTSLNEHILAYLATADFAGADMWLAQLNESYRDGGEDEAPEGQIRYSALIDHYRADIALLKRLNEVSDSPKLLTMFQEPETLAAAVIYGPISVKYDAFINQDALMLPPAGQGLVGTVTIEKVELPVQEQISKVTDINSRLSEQKRCDEIHEYAISAHGLPLLLTIVHTKENAYLPYLLEINEQQAAAREMNLADIPTVRLIKELRNEAIAQSRDFDADSIIAATLTTDDVTVSGEAVPAFELPTDFRPLDVAPNFSVRLDG